LEAADERARALAPDMYSGSRGDGDQNPRRERTPRNGSAHPAWATPGVRRRGRSPADNGHSNPRRSGLPAAAGVVEQLHSTPVIARAERLLPQVDSATYSLSGRRSSPVRLAPQLGLEFLRGQAIFSARVARTACQVLIPARNQRGGMPAARQRAAGAAGAASAGDRGCSAAGPGPARRPGNAGCPGQLAGVV